MKKIIIMAFVLLISLTLVGPASATRITAMATANTIPQFDFDGNITTIRVLGIASTRLDEVSLLHVGFGLEIVSQFIEYSLSSCISFKRYIGTICDTTFYISEGQTASCPISNYWSGECDHGYRVTNESFYGNSLLTFALDETSTCRSFDCDCL